MPAHSAAASMQRVPLAAAGVHATLSFYPPGFRQPAHSHERAHVSILVGGSIHEVRAGHDEFGYALQLQLRPYEARHQVEFGPQGALILAIDIEDIARRATCTGWIHRDLSVAQRVLLNWVLAEGAARDRDAGDCIRDLVASIEGEELHGTPPLWLTQARECLIQDPAIARIDVLARDAGVHRAHFARAFQHWFGTSPSLFRRRAMLTRAIAAIASGERLVLAAQVGGFADQSHLCRTMRSMIGTTPERLARHAARGSDRSRPIMRPSASA